MERFLAWYRVGSSYGAVLALIVANAIPLIGVLILGWSVWNILVIYWLENGVVGVFNVLKIARADGSQAPPGPSFMVNGQPATSLSKLGLIPFFAGSNIVAVISGVPSALYLAWRLRPDRRPRSTPA